jgi:hypothetical protein
VLYQSFGKDKVGKAGPLEDLLSRVHKLGSYDAQLVMRETYEEAYEIFNHDAAGDSRPLGVVAMHPKENVSQFSPLFRMVTKFVQYNIPKYFHCSLPEFLNMPRDMVEECFKVANAQAALETPLIQEAAKELAAEKARTRRQALAANKNDRKKDR